MPYSIAKRGRPAKNENKEEKEELIDRRQENGYLPLCIILISNRMKRGIKGDESVLILWFLFLLRERVKCCIMVSGTYG